jgi:hypothetical protein
MPEWRDWIVLVSEPYVKAVDGGLLEADLRRTLFFAARLAHRDPTPYKGHCWTNDEIGEGATIVTVAAPDSKHVIVGLEPEMDQLRATG